MGRGAIELMIVICKERRTDLGQKVGKSSDFNDDALSGSHFEDDKTKKVIITIKEQQLFSQKSHIFPIFDIKYFSCFCDFLSCSVDITRTKNHSIKRIQRNNSNFDTDGSRLLC